MELNLEPVKVDLQIETPSLERGAFYSLCFITENDEAPRTLEVNTLSDLLENGYTREDLAYNFCVGVFAQQGIESVYIRAKRSYETYEEAFSSDSNDDYYYLVIESKDSEVISDFNDFVVSSDDYKLQFYSSNEEPIEGRKLVHYFFDRGSDKNDFYLNKVMGEPDYLESVETPPDVEREGLVFTVQDINIGQGAFTVWSSADVPLGDYQWSLENLDTGTVVASSDGTISEGFLVKIRESYLEVSIPLDMKATRYEFKSEGRWIGLDVIQQIEAFSEGINVLSGQPKYKVVIEQYAKNFSCHSFYLNEGDLTVPDTLPSHITECDDMFSGCQFFNQDISSWDVSAVENMDSMFYGCESFNQDLSQWCVSLISESPDSFSEGSALSEENLPVWGTCPRGENGLIDEDIDEEEEIPTNFRFRIESGSMSPEQVGFEIFTDFESEPLELVLLDSDTGEYIETIDFSGEGKYETEYLEGFFDPSFPEEFEDNTYIIYSGLENPINTFEVRSKHSRVSITRYLSPTSMGYPNAPDDFDGTVEVLSYSTTIPNQITKVENSLLLLPSYIPKAFNNFNDSFGESTHIGTDITGWDVSHVKSMRKTFSRCSNFNQDISRWDVSNVVDMERMFRGNNNFNQDLSSWCVKNISSQPYNFDIDCPSWTLPRPQWGTCPVAARLDPYDPNYQAIPRMAAIFIQEEKSLSPVELQQQRLAYPEAAWIASCGNYFPSRVNWLHKYLTKVDVRKRDAKSKVPELSTTTAVVMKVRATVGSGLTTQGIIIHEQVSLDWIKWALGRKVWRTLYTNERINASPEGLDLVVNDVKEVLNLAIEEEMLSEYRITEVLFDRHSNNLSLKFSCKLMETILFVDISGSLYY